MTLAGVGAPVAAVIAGPTLVNGSVWVAFAWVDGAHPAVPVEDPTSYGRLLAVRAGRVARRNGEGNP